MEQTRTTTGDGEQGFMLLAVIVAIFLVLLVLSVAAPKVAQNLRRDREVEAIHRGNQYVRAIQLYYRKFGRYPASMDALEKSNNIRFLRQKYVDPMTGKVDWRLIHFGEQKTTVKGFFGQPLAGLPGSTGGLGSAAANSSGIGANSPTGSTSAYGSPTSSGAGGFGGGISIGTTLGGASGSTGGGSTGGISGFSSSSGSSGSSDSPSSTGGITSQSASTFTGGGGTPFVGVGIPKDGDSITVLNEQTSYRKWEFLYDPLIEQMGAKAALLGGSPANSSSGFGSSSSGFGTSSGGFGSSPSGFGTGSSGFGNTPGTSGSPGTGSSPAGTTPPSGSNAPQQ